MNKNLVSIILPVFNSEKYIKKTIDSIKKQSYQNWELIIIDDASIDNGLNIIKESIEDIIEKVNLIVLEKNVGAANARNIGIKKAKGQYLAFIDSDDIWENNKLKEQINFMQKKCIEFSYSSYFRFKNMNLEKLKPVDVPEKMEYNDLLKNTIILTSTVIIDITKIDRELVIMPDLKTGEDNATWYKILKTGIIAYSIDNRLVKYRVRKNSLSSNKIKNTIQLWKIYKYYENLNFIKRMKNIMGYLYNAIKKRISFEKM